MACDGQYRPPGLLIYLKYFRGCSDNEFDICMRTTHATSNNYSNEMLGHKSKISWKQKQNRLPVLLCCPALMVLERELEWGEEEKHNLVMYQAITIRCNVPIYLDAWDLKYDEKS